jgi:hypothetical protein
MHVRVLCAPRFALRAPKIAGNSKTMPICSAVRKHAGAAPKLAEKWRRMASLKFYGGVIGPNIGAVCPSGLPPLDSRAQAKKNIVQVTKSERGAWGRPLLCVVSLIDDPPQCDAEQKIDRSGHRGSASRADCCGKAGFLAISMNGGCGMAVALAESRFARLSAPATSRPMRLF